MNYAQFNQAIELIYQAIFDSDKWLEVLERLNACFHSTATGLFIQNSTAGASIPIPFLGISDEWINRYSKHHAFFDPAFSEKGLLMPGKIFTEQTFNSIHNDPNYYHGTEFFHEWMKPQGFYHMCGGVLVNNGDSYLSFALMRSQREGQYTDKEIQLQTVIANHLCKAVELSDSFDKLQYRMRNAEHLLERMGHGVITLDSRGFVLECNSTALSHIDNNDGISIKQGKLATTNGKDQKTLNNAIKQALGQSQASKELPIKLQMSACASLFFTLMPATQQHQSKFQDHSAILIIESGQQNTPISTEYLQSAYRLTASEARLTQHLAKGKKLKVAAADTGVSYETARGYLKSIFEKTGTHRQVDLVVLMNSDPAARLCR